MIVSAIVAGWVTCGVLAASIDLANHQSEHATEACKFYRKDLALAIVPMMFGPVALLVELSDTGFAENGMQLLPRGCSTEIPPVVLKRQYWVCTDTYIAHHPAKKGMLTRFGRLSDRPAYTTVECAQWSAKMTDGTLGGGATEAPNAHQVGR